MFPQAEIKNPAMREAVALFNEAYQAQMADDYNAAIKLYKESIEIFPTAEAYTFLGWAYSFQGEYDLAIAECLAAIAVDADFGNPYNDIGIGGLYMTTNAQLETGTPIFLRMTVGGKEIGVSGVVVYTDPGHGVGVRFHNLSDEHQSLFNNELGLE